MSQYDRYMDPTYPPPIFGILGKEPAHLEHPNRRGVHRRPERVTQLRWVRWALTHPHLYVMGLFR